MKHRLCAAGFALVLAGILPFPAKAAQAAAIATKPTRLTVAERALRTALFQVEHSSRDYNGDRAKAIQSIKNALADLREIQIRK